MTELVSDPNFERPEEWSIGIRQPTQEEIDRAKSAVAEIIADHPQER